MRDDPTDLEIVAMLPNTVPDMIHEWWKEDQLSEPLYTQKLHWMQRRMKSLEKYGYTFCIGHRYDHGVKMKVWVKA